ncbi:MAG: DUF2924 domain-containing protein [Desulfobacterales bacterium]|nr:DUF2924 domain-containing protein [Desulfobacterales bacterium]
MSLNITQEIEKLKVMNVKALQNKYIEVFGETTHSKHRDFLWRRIAWRMQANVEGDISERARKRAMEIANDADLRVRAPNGKGDDKAKDSN